MHPSFSNLGALWATIRKRISGDTARTFQNGAHWFREDRCSALSWKPLGEFKFCSNNGKKMRRGESRPSQRLLSSRPFSEHTIYFSEHLLCARSTDRDRPLLPAVFLLRSAPAAGESGCSISQVRAGVGTRDSGKLGEDRVIGKRSKSLAKVAAGRAGS